VKKNRDFTIEREEISPQREKRFHHRVTEGTEKKGGDFLKRKT